jgi:hypothetical protein
MNIKINNNGIKGHSSLTSTRNVNFSNKKLGTMSNIVSQSKENTYRGETHASESRTTNNTALKGNLNSNALRGANSTVNVTKHKTKTIDIRVKD